ncbi:carbohydrate-binding domain-containing protein [Paenibacillus sp. MMS20-IR301]|uniref:carbohydrate-binding domain-containing protein n=1 Tax=Paenibacillus sp. MMS20-IR301 TaxID=2895946 RepID=UPI0028E5EF2C|nr:carbohydrate-binding domain-containing protein [Paenibacillus sp. MMS20-IR301]WNS41489.1 carbohydrate-binding domain-containing protein [Paenibacillus sp. MMS20-IR301]
MKTIKLNSISVIALAALLTVSATGCSNTQSGNGGVTAAITQTAAATQAVSSGTASASDSDVQGTAEASVQDTSEWFSDRDLEQSADLTGATEMSLVSNQDVTLSEEGVYVLSGEAENVTVTVDAAEEAKVQIVLDGVSITNEDAPAIYVKAADKVFVTSTDSENYMNVTGSYVADGETNLDAVIFSRADLTLNGTGTLGIVSSQGNGISSKDELKITGGTYTIESAADALEANDAILIADGTITIDTQKDGLHSENEEDTTLGNIYIEGGTLEITAADDAITGNNLVQIDGGTLNIKTAVEGIEGNNIIINEGKITVYATDDGINATPKANADASIVVNGGTINVTMASGDTDAFDSNGNLYVNGGTINVEATSAFDADGTAELNGGTVTVNGEKITEITESRGGGGGGFRGGAGGGGRGTGQ